MPSMSVTFHIMRCGAGGTDSRFDTYTLNVDERMSVLDALDIIRVTQDSSLLYRHSCHHSSCGTCAMRINGKDALACITAAQAATSDSEDGCSIRLEPLRGLPWLGDLVVDMRAFYRFIEDDWGTLRDSEGRSSAALPVGVSRFTRLENCIECGACVSACPTSADPQKGFAGPATLAALNREISRQPERLAELMALVTGPHGESLCERHIVCSRACPNGVSPARGIMELRRLKERLER